MDAHDETVGIRVDFSTDPQTGEVTAYNHDLHVLAVGDDEETARARFFEALRFRAETELAWQEAAPGQ